MRKGIVILLGLFLVLFAFWLLLAPLTRNIVSRLENLSYDIQLQTRFATKKPLKNNRIVIIDIDERSLQVEGHWPWPREKLSTLLTQLKKQGAAIIAFDLVF